jgi:small subunit ribosomal protein S6
MRLYETTFIVNPQSDDATLDRQVKSVTDLITGNGGKVVKENRMGTRRLAFEVKGLTQGYYTSIIFEGPTGILPQLDRHFKLEDPFVRYLTIQFEGDPNAEETGGGLFGRRGRGRGHDDDDSGGRGRRDRDHRSSDRRPARPESPAAKEPTKEPAKEAAGEAAPAEAEEEKKPAPAADASAEPSGEPTKEPATEAPAEASNDEPDEL